MQMDLSQFDAVFQEGYEEPEMGTKLSAGLALFRIGRLVMKTLSAESTTIGRRSTNVSERAGHRSTMKSTPQYRSITG